MTADDSTDSGKQENPDDVVVVLVTVPDSDTGRALAQQVVEARLAACGSLIPGLTSVYRWEGRVQQDPDALIIFKTTAGRLPALKKTVVAHHPYEVPELLVLPTIHGHLPYLEWVRNEVGEPGRA
jgi:periplasmic divalent cation tolerance protein